TRFSRDWSSDVCSSDLPATAVARVLREPEPEPDARTRDLSADDVITGRDQAEDDIPTSIGETSMGIELETGDLMPADEPAAAPEIGRASCRKEWTRRGE